MANKIRSRIAALAAIAAFAAIAFAPSVRSQSNTTPQYTPGGELVTISGFETWVFVGSNLGLAYKEELPATTARETAQAQMQLFHNIYISPEAYAYFVKNREFPDPTILVMDVYTAADKEPRNVLAKGFYDGERIGLQFAVKDSHSPQPHAQNWAYYTAQNMFDPSHTLNASSPAHPDDECESCHQMHASKDNVWVQFYPVLRKLLPPAAQ
jgi:hypothetical protein